MYFFAIFVKKAHLYNVQPAPVAGISYTSRDKESNVDELGRTTALIYVDYLLCLASNHGYWHEALFDSYKYTLCLKDICILKN